VEGRSSLKLPETCQAFGARERATLLLTLGATLFTLLLRFLPVASLLLFVISALALAGLAAIVGDATDQLGSRLGPGATGVLQSALGNLPGLPGNGADFAGDTGYHAPGRERVCRAW
jgi:hypothetical protein